MAKSWDLIKFRESLDEHARKRFKTEQEYFVVNPPQREINLVEPDLDQEEYTIGFWFHENGVTTCRKTSTGYSMNRFQHIQKEFIQVILEFYQP